MPIEVSMWRVDSEFARIQPSSIDLEARLEDLLSKNIEIASSNWMVIGRQVPTPWGKFIDLLCLDADGNVIVLELKRSKTDREVVAQLLDYGSFVRTIQSDEIPPLFSRYRKDYFEGEPAVSLEDAFKRQFGVARLPDELNENHELVIVAATLDSPTERIVQYLAEHYEVSINAIFFQVFRDGDREYLTRAWLREPGVVEESQGRTAAPSEKVEWNGEYYVNFGNSEHRNWDDARRYGFVSAGYSSRLRQAMQRLEPRNRIWVNVPGGTGYVGVGIVEDAAVTADKFLVANDRGDRVPILQMPLKATDMGHSPGDPENMEWVVRVRWIKTLPLEKSIRERGFFGNQNCVVEPRDKKWIYTIERLREHFGIQD